MRQYIRLVFFLSTFVTIVFAIRYYLLAKKGHQAGHYLILSSGDEESPYFKNCQYITNLLNVNLKEHKIINLPSTGSYENFDRLQNKTADLIVAQRDVIVSKYFSKEDPFRSFEILMPLFPEALQILVRDSTNRIITLKEFSHLLQANTIKSIGIGQAGSATNRTFYGIRNMMGLFIPSTVVLSEKPLSESIADFEKGDLDVLVYFSAPPIKFFDLKKISYSIVSFQTDELNRLLTYFKDLEITKFSAQLYYKNIIRSEINTLGTWAFLICSTEFENSSEEEIVDRIPTLLVKDIYTTNPDNQVGTAYFSKLFSINRLQNGDFKIIGHELNYGKFFMDVPLTKGASSLFGIFSIGNQIGLWFLIFLLIIIVYLLFRYNKNISIIRWREHYGHNIYSLLTTMMVLMCICYIIRGAELNNFYEYGVKSPILNLKFKDTLEWLTIFIFTHHDAHIFPVTTTGAIAASAAFVLGGGALLSSIIIQIIQNDKMKNRASGKLQFTDEGHIVICGWNNKAIDLAVKLIEVNKQHGNKLAQRIILLNRTINNMESGAQDDQLHLLYHNNFIEYSNGDATDISALERVNLHEAKTVIIISEGKNISDDEKVLLSAYTINSYCREKRGVSTKPVYLVVEITDPDFIPRLEKTGADVIISSGELVNNLIIQDSICQGIYNPIRSLISYSDSNNDFYIVTAKKYSFLQNMRFDDLLIELRKRRLQLIGFRRIFLYGEIPITNKQHIRDILSRERVGLEYIINPQTHDENEIRTEENDEIIVLATSKDYVDQKLNEKTH
jgi:TRAP-type uncharacterized transport system substrate-binding protein